MGNINEIEMEKFNDVLNEICSWPHSPEAHPEYNRASEVFAESLNSHLSAPLPPDIFENDQFSSDYHCCPVK
jgi:hypothetical protein